MHRTHQSFARYFAARLGLAIGTSAILTASLTTAYAASPTTQAAPVSTPVSTTTAITPVPAVELSPFERARNDGVDRLLAEVRTTELTKDIALGQLIDDLAATPFVREALAQSRQVGGPRYIAGDVVQVRLEAPGQAVADALGKARSVLPQPPLDEATLATLIDPVRAKTFVATGSTSSATTSSATGASATGAPTVASTSAQTRSAPPRTTLFSPSLVESAERVSPGDASPMLWATEPVTASAISRAVGNARSSAAMLRTARAAEATARQNLRATLLDLQLDGKPLRTITGSNEIAGTLADAASIFGVDYRDDGSVEVKISIDGPSVLNAFEQARAKPE